MYGSVFYSKSDKPIWNEPKEPYSKEDIIKLFAKKEKNGRRYTTVPIHAPGETQNGNSSKPFKGMLPPKGRHWRTNVETLEKWDKVRIVRMVIKRKSKKENIC